jgi:uncharacterized phage-associated protein
VRKFFRYDPKKALNVVLYLSEKLPVPTFFYLGKILYFADKAHLQKYGRQICGDRYIAMERGPVPSNVYDMLKDVQQNRRSLSSSAAKKAFRVVEGHYVQPKIPVGLEYLSESDIECLDWAIGKYGSMGFDDLQNEGHDPAYKATWSKTPNRTIDIRSIIQILPDGKNLLKHLEEVNSVP